ncbi:MAG: 30S ribosomal protein S12 [Candidatus Huberarchaeum crystalense]|uniref:30S ribosomal protein S12 n=1 Tax=Huberarchaeum crystalense TaxID=2014257 RepID=A0A2G9LJM8_HUBC1|nr:MAG: 30S ribosomal protein S12 [Candidatus Huberarchaeum crystalense]
MALIRKLLRQKKAQKLQKKRYVHKLIKRTKKGIDPLEGSPQARALVLEKRTVEQKQPHSGLIRVVRTQLIKSGRQVTAFLPREGAEKHIAEHDIVTIESVHGAQGGAKGAIPGVKYLVIKVNGVSLEQIRRGKKQKPIK